MMILALGTGVLDGGAGVDAAALGHPDVHQHDVRDGVGDLLDASAPSPASPDDLDVLLLLEDHLQPAPEQRMVVDDEHADRVTRPEHSRLGGLLGQDVLHRPRFVPP
jgi:hypothetical protein